MSSGTSFIEANGLNTPCRLSLIREEQVIVSFPEGLQGRAHFDPLFKTYEDLFRGTGIDCSRNTHLPSNLKEKAVVHLSDNEFGEAFFRVYFPLMKKHDPSNFVWKVYTP